METRERPITPAVIKDALKWAQGEMKLVEFMNKHNVQHQTAYRMLAAGLASEIRNK